LGATSFGHHKQLKPRNVAALADRDMEGVHSQFNSRGLLQPCYRAIADGYMTLQDPDHRVTAYLLRKPFVATASVVF